ncbi:HD domain-containing protein [Paenalkalicoccus suaedae]|uniref:HD domain-containing protein n=1 Tax=Paenalkalicoccus suaedae TaxID=2592382 RepID=A0A859FFI7_9BACI|nr:HD domain-containing phosphohydrolase [Paenalkalicoccus suaedae]QKS71588.1 HD domain-containing protein [Paenalkalicoccus suaedae]
MRYVSLERVQQGEKLGKHILSNDGRILLHSGVSLTIGLLSKLRQMGVRSLFLQDEHFDDIEMEEVVSETTKREAIKTLANAIQYIQDDKPIKGEDISKSVDKMIEEIMLNGDILIQLTDVRTKDNDMFVHLVNTCIISVMVGVQMGLAKQRIQELAVGAILHDVGKLVSDVKVKDIPVGYDPNDELMQHHAWKGFNLLRKIPDISTLSAHIALTHHEHIDGTGKPRGMKGEDIHFLSKIVAVANEYDRLISSETNAMFPHEACEEIMGKAETVFDYNVVWRFLRCIAFYPNGTQVKLSNNRIGIVVDQHKGLPQRPIIRTYDDDGDTNFSFEEVDLAKETTIFITKVFA